MCSSQIVYSEVRDSVDHASAIDSCGRVCKLRLQRKRADGLVVPNDFKFIDSGASSRDETEAPG